MLLRTFLIPQKSKTCIKQRKKSTLKTRPEKQKKKKIDSKAS